jgi:DHA1 family tetracycline resistance protein-like MFS transporter
LPKKSRRQVEILKLNPFRSLGHVFRPSPIRGLIFVFILFSLAGQVHPSIWTLFTEYRFGWTPGQVGISLALVGVLSAISQGWLTGIVVKKLGEFKTVLYGAFGCAVGFVLYAVATQGWMMYAILIATAVFWVGQAPLQSLISKHTPSSEQGELQGSLMSLMSLTSVATPLIATSLFSHFTASGRASIFAGAPYAFAAVVSFASWFILLKLSRDERVN